MPSDRARSFEHVLRDSISLDDGTWHFSVANLPSSESANKAGLIKMIHLATNKDARHRLTLRYVPIELNRAIKDSSLDKYIAISFADFRSLRGIAPPPTAAGVLQPTTARECSDYAVKLLRNGIRIQDVHYHFYGHSNSQLKSRTCFLYAAGKEAISTKIESLGDFTKMKTVAKKAKRIGLLFSVARAAMTVDPNRVEDVADIETGTYVFTDGCGLVAPKLAQDLSRRIRIAFRNVRYTPSVFQIRYRGYKGVVTLDPTMARAGPWLKMRKSMKKFSGGDDLSFSVVEYSRPYTFGHLNDEIIVLLDALGIDRKVLMRKQQDHLHLLDEATRDPRAAFRLLCHISMPETAEKVVIDSLEAVKPTVARLVNAEYDKMLNKRDEQRCRILIPRSRLLFGVCDAWEVLEEGQCAVKVTMDGDGQPYALKGMKVLVTRNPCLHPGDIQKLDVVARPELGHLVDCIVFPTKGSRPSADMMSGGDLDGDTFFVSWDPDIIPSTVSQAAQYPGAREPIRFNPITDDDRLVYFAKYTNASLGRVKNLYLKWARHKGAMSPECQELNRLFSQCVDGNRIKDSQLAKFDNPPPAKLDSSPFVLDELHEASKNIITAQRNNKATGDSMDGYTLDGVELLLNRDNVAMSEMELVKLAFRWCRKTNNSFAHLLHTIDFNALTAEEKSWILAQVAPSMDIPSMAMNALCTSPLFAEGELGRFNLDHSAIHWKRVYTSDQDRLATFLEASSRNMELFHKTLVVFRPSDRLTVAMYVPQQITPSDDFLVDTRVKMLAFPHSQGTETQSRLSLPTKKGYRLYCDDNTLQLFEGKRGNTWLYIGRGASNDSSYRNMPRTQDRRKARQETLDKGINFDFRASIALDKFGKGLQTHVGRLHRQGISAAEVYIISNRDTRSMRNLDLWEDYIDNEEELALFEQIPKEYDVPGLSDVDWGAQDRLVVEVAKRGNLSALQTTPDTDGLRRLFEWLLAREKRDLIVQCYKHLAGSIRDDGLVDSAGGLRVMLDFMQRMPAVSVSFVHLGSWELLKEGLNDILQADSAVLLRCVILSESDHGELVVAPFHHVLNNTAWLSLSDLSQLVELVSLTVHSREVAMDILLQGFEQHSSRLLTGRPAVVQHAVRNMIGIALEHIGELHEQSTSRSELLDIRLAEHQTPHHWGTTVEVVFRIDSTEGIPAANMHVRLVAASAPARSILEQKYSMDGLLLQSQSGVARIMCLHPLPPYYQACSWRLQECGLFATTKTTLDAVTKIAQLEDSCCGVFDQIVGIASKNETTKPPGFSESLSAPSFADPLLNESQNAAVKAAEAHRLTCLWGPPGTGKTQTIVSIIRRLQQTPDARILVTAPTHNAVDNVMRRYLKRISDEGCIREFGLVPLRVSTEIRKVAEDVRKYTCDALVGQEVNSSHAAMRQAKKRVATAPIVFTSCIGAGLGLLREEVFDMVIVDEASQQTEPASLVPLAKGCVKVILVGDHIQLRPTVQNISTSVSFDVSLFERLYMRDGTTPGMAKVLLDTQYRMHASICQFASREFYGGKLLSGVSDEERPLPPSSFPWPPSSALPASRMVFVECSQREDLGSKSKANKGQADLCVSICRLLLTTAVGGDAKIKEAAQDVQGVPDRPPLPSITVLTPYSRQAQLLKRLLSGPCPSVEISSVDGFQGREADIIVFITVRCNESGEIGFLKDVRRMNVALTRAKLGFIMVGSTATLTGGDSEEGSTGLWKRLLAALRRVNIDK